MIHSEDGSSSTTLPRLSKSKYLAWLQCPKRLSLEVYHPEHADPPDPATQAALDMGTEIGIRARGLFPGGVLINESHRQRDEALARTASVMADPSVTAVFEGAFQHDGVFVRADILERDAGPNGSPHSCSWRLIEVKSSSRVKNVHLDDLAIQSQVVRGNGILLSSICLLHINTDYVYEGGDIDWRRLFAIEDVTAAVEARLTRVPDHVAAMKAVLLSDEPPKVEPGRHCHSPYECPFWNHCTKEKPDRWIYYLPGSKELAGRLAERGISTIDDIPADEPLSPSQRRVKENAEWISPGLRTALQSLQYPIHHVDFETVMLAVPRFPSTRPYQSIPVQWSNHIEEEPGRLIHQEFLHVEPTEPRKRWAEALIESLGREGSICVYSSYEEAMMRQLVEAFPEFRSAFQPILKRLWDLHEVIKHHYYHPRFNGSYSIKSVLPAVVPSLGYSDLTIQSGGQAAAEYYRMVFVETDWIEQATVRAALLQYCARDTLALVELRRALQEKIGG
ncbi:MAG: DUF2779 domain-containing protein [Nitrospira sp.]|nr:DUF2779 domain-containing protein [Nitrospira sp.]MCP9441019.1 DUF2779 domain-containing protein [Nitrospira sp.]